MFGITTFIGRDVELGRKSEGCKLLSKTTNGRRHQAGVPSHDQVFFPPQVTRRDLFFIDTVIQDWISAFLNENKVFVIFFVDVTLNLSQPKITRNRFCHIPRGSWKRTEVWGKSPPGPHHAWSCPAPARRSCSPTRWPTSRWRRSPTTTSPSVLSSSPHFQWRCERSLPAQKLASISIYQVCYGVGTDGKTAHNDAARWLFCIFFPSTKFQRHYLIHCAQS